MVHLWSWNAATMVLDGQSFGNAIDIGEWSICGAGGSTLIIFWLIQHLCQQLHLYFFQGGTHILWMVYMQNSIFACPSLSYPT